MVVLGLGGADFQMKMGLPEAGTGRARGALSAGTQTDGMDRQWMVWTWIIIRLYNGAMVWTDNGWYGRVDNATVQRSDDLPGLVVEGAEYN